MQQEQRRHSEDKGVRVKRASSDLTREVNFDDPEMIYRSKSYDNNEEADKLGDNLKENQSSNLIGETKIELERTGGMNSRLFKNDESAAFGSRNQTLGGV